MVREQHVERCLKTKCQENLEQFFSSVASVTNNLPSNAKVYVALLHDVVFTDLNSSTY
jgi:hypothetical protein